MVDSNGMQHAESPLLYFPFHSYFSVNPNLLPQKLGIVYHLNFVTLDILVFFFSNLRLITPLNLFYFLLISTHCQDIQFLFVYFQDPYSQQPSIHSQTPKMSSLSSALSSSISSSISSSMFLLLMKSVPWFLHDCCGLPHLLPCVVPW